MKLTLSTLSFFLSIVISYGQIVRNGETLYGNEWINYDQSYLKIKVGQDGIYQITGQQLADAGFPISQIDATEYQLIWLGLEQRIWTSKSSGPLSAEDIILFYGEKNRSQVDRYLFKDPNRQMLNPEYALTSDTSAYFLTWTPGIPATRRFEEVPNDLTGVGAPLPWYLHHEKLVFSDRAFKGALTRDVRYSHYSEGEGFASFANVNHNFKLKVDQIDPTGDTPELHLRFTGNNVLHEIEWSWNNNHLSDLNVFTPYLSEGGDGKIIDTLLPLQFSDLKSENSFNSSLKNPEDNRLAYGIVELIYPRKFSFNQENLTSFQLEDVREGAYLEINNFAHDGQSPRVFDLTSGTIIQATVEDNILKVKLPAGNARRDILIVSIGGILTAIPELMNFEDLASSEAGYIIISHEKLFSGDNVVQQYADYRASAAGGGFQTQIIEIKQLIDQFAYGVARHPLSIKNFINYISDHWANPEFIFLIGKGLDYTNSRNGQSPYDFLPVYGHPGSDNLLTSKGQSSTPLIPMGRLAARDAGQVATYLDKVKRMEDLIAHAPQTIKDRAWMKRVLHLGGGKNVGEVTHLFNRLNIMKDILETSTLQADVSSWTTQSQDIIDFNQDETVLDRINDGVMIKTYFGHGSVTTTQFNGFEDPQFLANRDRYSVMLSLGCHTGDLFVNAVSLGEANIFAENKGASIYMATSGLGFLTALDIFGREWYELAGSQMLNEPVGRITQKVISDYDQADRIDIRTLLQQLTLHGDPAFRLSNITGPDYTIDFSSVRFHPDIINTSQDSFTVSFDLYNLGSLVDQELLIEFEHLLPNGEVIPLRTAKIQSDSFIRTLYFTLPLFKEHELQGNNRLLVNINTDESIEEKPDPAAFQNNSLVDALGIKGIRLPLVNNAVIPLSPREYSIVNHSEIELIGSTSDVLAKKQDFIIQVDTSAKFSSASLREYRISQSGGLIKLTPDIGWQENQVYFWRISPDSTGEQGYIWKASSFTYLPDAEEGWCQAHHDQFADGKSEGLVINKQGKFQFSNKYDEIKIENVRETRSKYLQFFYNGQQFSSPLGSPLKAGISIIIINPYDREWYINEGASYGSVLIPGENNLYVYDVAQPEGRKALIHFLDDIVPDGYFVLMYTHLKDTVTSFHPEEWAADSLLYGDNLFAGLERHGAKLIRQMEVLGTVPYNFFFEKNGKVADEDIAYLTGDSILSTAYVPYLGSLGAFLSTPVGPSSAWHQLSWSFDWSQNRDDDHIELSVYGLSQPTATPELLIAPVTQTMLDLSSISAAQYPYLQLKVNTIDSVLRSTPNLKTWKVIYDGFPDLAINPQIVYAFDGDSTTIGQSINLKYGVENISSYDMDSVDIAYTLTDTKNNIHFFTEKSPPIAAKNSAVLEYTFDTKDYLPGVQLLSVNVNPAQSPQEITYDNNILLERFQLQADEINPVLDVTFDGLHIMNGDIVSPEPMIRIVLKDENKSILLKDSSLFDLSLIYPDGQRVLLNLDDPDISFSPASNSDNIASIELQKSFETDGIYELIVNAKDEAGNTAGNNDLRIQFEVVNKTSARHLIPYPNPFTESTQFLYTLTGSLPEIFKIQIYTVDGSVVKEIDLAREEPLKIGTHLTDFRWDGTDQYNDRLANGIYLYRVIIKDQDQNDFEHYNASFDGFFEKNVGKIVILR